MKVLLLFYKDRAWLKSQSLAGNNLGRGCFLRPIHHGSLWGTVLSRYYLP